MSDDNRADDGADEIELADEDRLPWLEAVEEEEEEGGPSVAKLVAAIVIGLVAIGVIVGGLFWLGNRGAPGPNGEVIAAPGGDYKQRPENPGGMNVAGEGETAYAASGGAQPKGNLNVDAVPEAPVAPGQPAPRPAAPQPVTVAPAPQPLRPSPPPPPQPRPVPAPAAGPTIQLGAFSSQAAANSAWTAMAARFRYLAPLGHSVQAVPGRPLFRLRATGADAASVCGRLRAAGEACAVVN